MNYTPRLGRPSASDSDAPAFEGFFQSTRESSVSKNPLRPAAVSLQPQTPKPVTRVDLARKRVLHPAHSAR